ncbi:hypothetical protein [Serratia liquefaciens]|uniref:hypothetical protein n=1 Tax=Serratia liquefaciens TaxID=614 RepID=UPI0038B32BB5
MKNNLENQDIKTDKPLAMSYEALKADLDASLNAERAWEISMMAACGEDGPGSVSAFIKALAVENAGFKHALSVILEHVDVTDKGQAGVVAMIANDELFNSETPATDAALAAIEARGVEKFAEATIAIGEQEKEESIIYAGKQAMLFAKQLREWK